LGAAVAALGPGIQIGSKVVLGVLGLLSQCQRGNPVVQPKSPVPALQPVERAP
jgi:hypothetical protein